MVSREEVLKAHKATSGVFEVTSKVPLESIEDLSTYYTPGVAFVSEEIGRDIEKVFDYTSKGNTIAIISDGTRILGLGDIGPYAGLPVMAGKAILFKRFGGVDAVPICIDTKDEDEIVKFVKNIAPNFGGITIEDIEKPKCINIADRLTEILDIPVLHDDRHGAGVVVLAAVINALRLAGKGKDSRIVINGAGAAGTGTLDLLSYYGYKDITVLDTKGAIYKGREGNDKQKEEIAEKTKNTRSGTLDEMVKGADLLIGFSVKGVFNAQHISNMNEKPIVFALANPVPEITYKEAKEAGAYIVATGRSDTPNQVNNVLAFPGIMRGMLDIRAKKLDSEMLKSASVAIAKGVGRRLSPDYIIPRVIDANYSKRIVPEIAAGVADAAIRGGHARLSKTKDEVRGHTKYLIERYMKIEKKISKLL